MSNINRGGSGSKQGTTAGNKNSMSGGRSGHGYKRPFLTFQSHSAKYLASYAATRTIVPGALREEAPEQ